MAPEMAPNPCLEKIEKIELTDRVKALKKIYFAAMPEICIERADLITQFSDEMRLFGKARISIREKARLYRRVLESKTPVIGHEKGYRIGRGGIPEEFKFEDLVGNPLPDQLFGGSTTQKFKGVPLYPELLGLPLWPELETVSKRTKNPYYLSDKDAEALNKRIFPCWINETILEIARERSYLHGVKKLTSAKLRPKNEDFKLLQHLVFFLTGKPECISHTIPDFSKVIDCGLEGMIEEAEKKEEDAHDPSKKDFYASIAEVLEGIIVYSHRLAEEAKRLADQATGDRKKELRKIAHIYRHVPENPARNFREALTTIWVCWNALHVENVNIGISLGRLDQVLYDKFKQDLNSGYLDLQSAAELLCCFWLKIGDHVAMVPQAVEQLFGGGGSNQAITIGGVKKEGKDVVDAVNELTYLILRTIELMKLRDPNLNARYYPGINDKDKKDKEYLRAICQANIRTGATPAIHNDIAVIDALKEKGDNEEQARDYGIVGCVETVSRGAYGSCSSILLNLASVLELTLFDGKHPHVAKGKEIVMQIPEPVGEGKRRFEKFKEKFSITAKLLADSATRLNDLFGRVHQDFYPTPILSAFFEGPMENGKDLSQGGALINSSGVTIIGFADVVDSLSALQEVVFGKNDPKTLAKLRSALEENFEGKEYESLYRRLINAPKYGKSDTMAIENAAWLLEELDKVFGNRKNYRDGNYRVGYWTMTMHTGFARLTGALPSGRKEGESFASGITPVSGVTPWVTEACNAVARLPSKFISNGMAFNVKLSPEGKPMLDRLRTIVHTYFDEGGMEIQFNIISHHDLDRAMNHPEEYPELLVRVSGYTAYFKDLGPEMQKEIISRTEFLTIPSAFEHSAKTYSLSKTNPQIPPKADPRDAQQDFRLSV